MLVMDRLVTNLATPTQEASIAGVARQVTSLGHGTIYSLDL
jgi:hypothetical protein